jgi:hypothetical protein
MSFLSDVTSIRSRSLAVAAALAKSRRLSSAANRWRPGEGWVGVVLSEIRREITSSSTLK